MIAAMMRITTMINPMMPRPSAATTADPPSLTRPPVVAAAYSTCAMTIAQLLWANAVSSLVGPKNSSHGSGRFELPKPAASRRRFAAPMIIRQRRAAARTVASAGSKPVGFAISGCLVFVDDSVEEVATV